GFASLVYPSTRHKCKLSRYQRRPEKGNGALILQLSYFGSKGFRMSDLERPKFRLLCAMTRALAFREGKSGTSSQDGKIAFRQRRPKAATGMAECNQHRVC